MKQMVFLIALTFSSLPAPVQSREFEVASIKPTNLVNVGVKSACHGIDSKFAARTWRQPFLLDDASFPRAALVT